MFHIEKLATVYLYAQGGLSRTLVGYRYHEIVISLISICVLGLPAAMLGSVLPLWMRAVPESSNLLGDRVGRLVTWNTLGAVVGVLVTGFVLMPTIGLRASFAALGLLLAAAANDYGFGPAPQAGHRARRRGRRRGLAGLYQRGSSWRNVFSIGIFRLSDMDLSQRNSSPTLFFKQHSKLVAVVVL